MAFAVSVVARGGKVVVSGLMGGNFSLPMVQWVYKPSATDSTTKRQTCQTKTSLDAVFQTFTSIKLHLSV
jgi:hypothetical protein